MKTLITTSYLCISLLPSIIGLLSLSFITEAPLRRQYQLFGSNNKFELQQNTPRRKVNKYAEFSKDKTGLDPIQTAMAKANQDTKMASIGDAPVRGTTVPNTNWAGTDENPSVRRRNQKSIIPAGGLDSIIPSDPFTFGYTKIGDITGAHGVKGELKIRFETDFADVRVEPESILYVKKPNRLSPRPIRVLSGRRQIDNVFLVRLENVKSRIGAAAFKNYEVFAKENDRPNLASDEYLIRDLVGLKCYLRPTESVDIKDVKSSVFNKWKKKRQETVNENAKSSEDPVATIVGVVPPDELCGVGSAAAKLMHSMLELRLFGSLELCLIPLVKEIVLSVDVASGRVVLDPPSGLLSITYASKEKKVMIKGFLPEYIDRIEYQERSVLEKKIKLLYPEGGVFLPLNGRV